MEIFGSEEEEEEGEDENAGFSIDLYGAVLP